MDIDKIKALANIMTEEGLTLLELEDEGGKIKLERQTNVCEASSLENVTLPRKGSISEISANLIDDTEEESKDEINFNNLKEIKSPMVGVFYAAPSPESEPFVKIGDKVKKGDTLCVIEAMKLMNDIVSEMDGEIVDICVNNGDVVEYAQTLFKIYK